MTWQTQETAPKDGTLIIGDFGWPWPLVTCWNDHEQAWVVATLQVNQVNAVLDPYFESDYERKLKRWQPMPDMG